LCVSADPWTNASCAIISGHCMIVACVLAKPHCHKLSHRWVPAAQFLGVHVQDCCHKLSHRWGPAAQFLGVHVQDRCHKLSHRWGPAAQFLGVHVQDRCHNSHLPRSTQICCSSMLQGPHLPINRAIIHEEFDTRLNPVVAQGPAGGSDSGLHVCRSCADCALLGLGCGPGG
jgi:hypothetical protein